MPRLLLHKILRLYAMDEAGSEIPNAWILCEDGRIAAIGAEPCPVAPDAVDVVRDLSGAMVTPGLVNMHHHFFQSVTRAVPATLGAFGREWIAALYPHWIAMTPQDMAAAARVAAAELALTGATTSVDHAFLTRPPHLEFAETGIEAALSVGIRLHLVHGAITSLGDDVPDRLRPVLGARVDDLRDTPDAIMARLERLALRHHDTSHGSRVQIAVGPLGIDPPRADLLRRMAEFARDIGAHLHTHMHPRQSERGAARAASGMDSLPFLDSLGWLRPGTALVHGTELTEGDVRLMADRGVALVHCPRTVVRLGYRVPPVGRWAADGLTVCFGVDGAASNDGGGLLPDLRLALLLHRVAQGTAEMAASWLTSRQVLAAVTRDAARVLGRSDIGTLEVGKAADIAAFEVCGIAHAGSVADPLDRLLFAGFDGHSALTVCGGAIIAEGGRLPGIDLAAVSAEACAAAARLAGEATGA